MQGQAALPAQAEEESPPIDLHTLLAQFIALRHEVHLQTRATRAQQEQNAETLRQLTETMDALRIQQAQARETQTQAQEEVARPLLKTLVDLHDALTLAERKFVAPRRTSCPSWKRSLLPFARFPSKRSWTSSHQPGAQATHKPGA